MVDHKDEIVRGYREADFPELGEMINALYREDEQGQPMTDAKILATVEELTAHPERGKILIFEVASSIVGYALVIYYWSNEYGGNLVFIDELYMRPKWRRGGIGTRFLEGLGRETAGNAVALQLEVTPHNRRAMALYKRLGFQKCKNTMMIRPMSPPPGQA